MKVEPRECEILKTAHKKEGASHDVMSWGGGGGGGKGGRIVNDINVFTNSLNVLEDIIIGSQQSLGFKP